MSLISYCFHMQLDDAELATAAAVKGRKAIESDLKDLQQQFDSLSKSKQEVACSRNIFNYVLFRIEGKVCAVDPTCIAFGVLVYSG